MDDKHRNLVFLPGAAGASEFWLPVATRLPAGWRKTLLSWPGAGSQPPDPHVSGFADLIAYATRCLNGPADLIAQSMGGVVALGVALEDPERVRRLVLVATSGGIDVAEFGARDWREDYRAEYPMAAPWLTEDAADYTESLSAIGTPTLLICGDADPISPVEVGRRLAQLLPNSELHVLRGGTHGLAHDRPDEVACLIRDHLR